tara:strand:+ start:3259 stop:17640 length:14382 start_codon:yes stop_codon:yes gene_type:complete
MPTVSRTTTQLLPEVFQTERNKKFLNATLDQWTQKGELEKISGFVGSKKGPSFKPTDTYFTELNSDRQNYQLEPSVNYVKDDGTVEYFGTYNDLVNQIEFLGGNKSNHDRLFNQQSHSWGMPVDIDPLVNYRNYYWLPTGPSVVQVDISKPGSTSTIKVKNNAAGAYNFSGYTGDNPTLTLYRGNTYKFEVNAKGHPFYIKTSKIDGSTLQYEDDFVTNNGADVGTVTFTVPKADVSSDLPDILFYACGNHTSMQGNILIEDLEDGFTTVDITTEILGKKDYTTEASVVFENGLKIKFAGTIPAAYKNKEYYVEGVGNEIVLVDTARMIVPEEFSEATSTVVWDQDGTQNFDQDPWDAGSDVPVKKDYFTINRNSKDFNAWSRSNRWFHESVLTNTATYNGHTVSLDQTQRAKRPIVQFEGNIQLFNYGNVGLRPIRAIETATSDAFSFVNGSLGHFIDGVELKQGDRVIFQNDTDGDVKSNIYEVTFVNVDSTDVLYLDLALAEQPAEGNTVIVEAGTNSKGKQYRFNGTSWVETQQKTKVQQAPLFDLFNSSGTALTDTTSYPASSFVGTTLFEVAQSTTGTDDTEYGIKIKYENFGTVADIVFNNTLSTDKLTYLDATNAQKNTIFTKSAYYKQNIIDVEVGVDSTVNNTITTQLRNGWTKQNLLTKQRAIDVIVVKDELKTFKLKTFNNISDVVDLEIDVFVNNVKKTLTTDYIIVTKDKSKFVQFVKSRTQGDKIVFETYAPYSTKNSNGYYEVPDNLERNGLNDAVETLTLGELNNHVLSITEDLPGFTGTQPGSTNLKDLHETKKYGRRIMQHAGSIPLATFLLTHPNANFYSATKFVSKEYSKFKQSFIKNIDNAPDGSVRDKVDAIIKLVSANKSEEFAFYHSDMIGWSENFTKLSYTVTDNNNKTYGLSAVFDKTKLSDNAVYVWVNDVQAVHGKDYTFDTTSATITFTTDYTFALGDKIEIREYADTDGSHIPPTPSKLGLYPAYQPSKYVDNTYRNQVNDSTAVEVIQGHDGSLTKAYGDIRDDLLLELEKRIYNNIKVTYDEKNLHDLYGRPGDFRFSPWTKSEWTEIESKLFLDWTGDNQIDYTSHNLFDAEDSFTWNYGQVASRLTGEILKGYWRGIYKDMYDTDRPHTHPWEMLGFAEKPSWWDSRYGSAPYTAGNDILWNDLEKGHINQGDRKGNYTKYIRKDLTDYLPVDSKGNLRSPNDFIVDRIIASQSEMKLDFKAGDGAPAETAWRRSSDWPFAQQIISALTSPARYFGTLWDTARIYQNPTGQYIYNETGTAVQPKDFVYYAGTFKDSNGVSQEYFATGYHVMIVEYLKGKNLDIKNNFTDPVSKLKLNLGYRLAGFSDKTNLKVIADSVSPGSTSNKVFIPEENYKIFLHQSTPIESSAYSGVIVQKTANGFKVVGYDPTQRSFKINEPIKSQASSNIAVGQSSEEFFEWQPNGFYVAGSIIKNGQSFYRVNTTFTAGDSFEEDNLKEIGSALPLVGGIQVAKYTEFRPSVTLVPYGTEYKTRQEVANFIQGYEQYLKTQGFIFDGYSRDLNTNTDWTLSIKEFLFWSTQNWAVGTVISLSPASESITYENTNGVVDTLINPYEGYLVAQQEGTSIPLQNINMNRQGNTTSLTTRPDEDGIYFAKFNVIQKEHVILFDNSTVFSDILYDPALGFRQERLKLTGFKTSDWNGDLFAPGFVFDEAKIEDWSSDKDYNVGDVVKYQAKFYVAKKRHAGKTKFNNLDWNLKDVAPQSALLPNFDYKSAQFEDFYNLDSDNFDEGQQTLARHLIGYQPRGYLEDLGMDESSQYKFYQGFIREKGTINSITKLLNAQFRASETNKYNVYEEWAFRTGGYGGRRTQEDIEYALNKNAFGENPQLLKLLEGNTLTTDDPAVQIAKNNLRIEPNNYVGTPFKNYDHSVHNGYQSHLSVFKYKNAGPINSEFVNVAKIDISDVIGDVAAQTYVVGTTIWVAKDLTNQWNLYRVSETGIKINRFDKYEDDGSTLLGEDQIRLTTDKPHGLAKDDLILIRDVDARIDGIYQIPDLATMDSTVDAPNEFSVKLPNKLPEGDGSSMLKSGNLLKLVSLKLTDTSFINTSAPLRGWRKNDVVSVTNNYENDFTKRWVNYQNTLPYKEKVTKYDVNRQAYSEYGHAIASDGTGRNVWVSAPGDQGGKLHLETRSDNGQFTSTFTINPSHVSNASTNLNGTFAFTSGSSSVTGNNTLFTEDLKIGDRIITASSLKYTVQSIESDIAMTIEESASATENSSATKKTEFDRFGHALALAYNDENRLVVSAPFASGFVKVVTLDGGDFSSTLDFKVNNTVQIYNASSSLVGSGTVKSWNSTTYVLAIETDTILAQDYQVTGTSTDGSTEIVGFVASAETTLSGEGYAEILNKDASGTWATIQTVTGNPPAANENFGSSVALSGDGNYAVFGVPGSESNKGRVEVYKYNTTTLLYDYFGDIQDAEALAGDKFGSSVAVDSTGQIFAVGAPFHSTTGAGATANVGAVFVYANDNGKFVQIAKLLPSIQQADLEFGSSITMNTDASKIVVGAPGYNPTGAPDTGRVFYFIQSIESFTADGSTTSFSLSFSPVAEDQIGVFETAADSTTTWSTPGGGNADSNLETADTSVISADNSSSGRSYSVDGSTANITFSEAPKLNTVFDVYRYTQQQTIDSNAPGEYNRYGELVTMNPATNVLAVSSKNASGNKNITFDKFKSDGSTLLTETTFDFDTTRFIDPQSESGTARVYGMYGNYFALDQQLESNTIDAGDKFGTGLSVSNAGVFVGAPFDDTQAINSGLMAEYNKGSSTTKGWEIISQQEDLVNPYAIQQNYFYNINSNKTVGFVDWIDPIKGKLPGPASSELKFISDHDPASYNNLTLEGTDADSINEQTAAAPTLDFNRAWGREHVGELWLNTKKLIYTWYEQGTLEYRKDNWGKLFPGATVDVFEWVESDVAPDVYNNNSANGVQGFSGIAINTRYYSSKTFIDADTQSLVTRYYFWVRDKIDVPNVPNRNLDALTVQRLIEDPIGNGYVFNAFIKNNAVSYANVDSLLDNGNIVHHVEWTTVDEPSPKHDEWLIVKEGDTKSKPNTILKQKLIDSLVGRDKFGNNIPDPTFSDTQKYGVEDGQSMIKNRTTVLTAVIENINSELIKHKIVSSKNLKKFLLKDEEPTVASNEYDIKVADNTELNYLNKFNTPTLVTGTKVLVATDSDSNGYWAIYTYQSDNTFTRTFVQTFDTTQYWTYADWYETGYSKDTLINFKLSTENDVLPNDSKVSVGEIVKVNASFDGNFRLLEKTDTAKYKEIGLGNGTIQIKESAYSYKDNALGYDSDTFDQLNYDQQPITELQNILNGIFDDIYQDDLENEYNKLWFYCLQQILAEQLYIDWAIKTSFLTVENDLKNLSTDPTYKPDQQEALLQYIDEVKPFHTKVRQYRVNYAKSDTFGSDITDFDNASYWNTNTEQYDTPDVNNSAFDTRYTTNPSKIYKDNYKLSVLKILIADGGSAYTEAPIITISGGGGTGAKAIAYVSNGAINKITVTDGGSGYTSTPTVTLSGGGREDSTGIAAKLHAVIDNDKIRQINTTLQFNRITGNNIIVNDTISEWKAETTYTNNNIRFGNDIYKVLQQFTSGKKFTDAVTLSDSSTTSTLTEYLEEWSAVDYIKAYYSTSAGMPGVQDSSTVIYGQLMSGLEYPGTKVLGPQFDTEATYDKAPYDAVPYDGQIIDEDGIATPSYELGLDKYVDGVGFTNSLAGTRPTDVVNEGNAFVDEYSSHAPEEVMPGSTFDTLDMKVFTNPSQGSPIMRTNSHIGDGSTTTFAIGQTPSDVDGVFVWVDGNLRRRIKNDSSTDYSIGANNTVVFTSAPASGQLITIQSFSISGSKISIKRNFTGDGTTAVFNLPVPFALADSTVNLSKTAFVTVNGVVTTATLSEGSDSASTDVTLSSAPASGSTIQITIFDGDAGEQTYSQVNTQTIKADGSTKTFALSQTPAEFGPLHNTVIVERNGERLSPPDTAYYQGDGSTFAFNVPTTINTATTPSGADVEVYLNGSRQTFGVDWFFNSLGITADQSDDTADQNNVTADSASVTGTGVVFFNTRPDPGDGIAIVVKIGHDYLIEGSNLTLTSFGSENDEIRVTSFTNHDLLGIRTEIFKGSSLIDASLGTYQTLITKNPVTTAGTVIDTFSSTTINSAQYFVVATDINDNIQVDQVTVTTDGSNVSSTNYGTVHATGTTDFVSYTSTITSGSVNLVATALDNVTKIKAHRMAVLSTDTSAEAPLSSNQESFTKQYTSNGSTAQTIFELDTSIFRGAEVFVAVSDGTSVESSQITIGFNGSTPTINVYNAVGADGSASRNTFSVTHSSSTLSLKIVNSTSTSVGVFGIASKLGSSTATTNNVGVEFIASQTLDTSTVTLDTFDLTSSEFDGAYYQVLVESANDSTVNDFEFATIHVAGKTANINHTQYGHVSDNQLATFDVSLSGTTVSLTATGATGGNTVYLYKLGFDTAVAQVDSNRGGFYTLSRTPTNTDYLWVTYNGDMQIAGTDYIIKNNKIHIPRTSYSNSDIIVVTSIDTTKTTEAIGYRVFKDMINRTHYKRIADASNTKLAKALKITDNEMFVNDASVLPAPDPDNNLPGVVFINKERITYFTRDLGENSLGQLMRGTLGTGALDNHPAGTDVVDAGTSQTVPGYSDTTTICSHIADGSTTAFTLFNADSTAFVPRSDGADVTVFVGGTKLLSGFTFDGENATITFTTAPASGRKIEIVRKTGRVWVNQGTSTAGDGKGIQGATGPEATFLLNNPTKLP